MSSSLNIRLPICSFGIRQYGDSGFELPCPHVGHSGGNNLSLGCKSPIDMALNIPQGLGSCKHLIVSKTTINNTTPNHPPYAVRSCGRGSGSLDYDPDDLSYRPKFHSSPGQIKHNNEKYSITSCDDTGIHYIYCTQVQYIRMYQSDDSTLNTNVGFCTSPKGQKRNPLHWCRDQDQWVVTIGKPRIPSIDSGPQIQIRLINV